MNEMQLPDRITINSMVMAGKPIIYGARLSLEYFLILLAHGTTIEMIPSGV
jgi:uncharacterized protein (DUF433 family)